MYRGRDERGSHCTKPTTLQTSISTIFEVRSLFSTSHVTSLTLNLVVTDRVPVVRDGAYAPRSLVRSTGDGDPYRRLVLLVTKALTKYISEQTVPVLLYLHRLSYRINLDLPVANDSLVRLIRSPETHSRL